MALLNSGLPGFAEGWFLHETGEMTASSSMISNPCLIPLMIKSRSQSSANSSSHAARHNFGKGLTSKFTFFPVNVLSPGDPDYNREQYIYA